MDRKYKVGGYVKLAKLWERSKDAAVAYHSSYYAEKFRDDADKRLVGVYIDITGNKEIYKRPEMVHLLKDCKNGSIQIRMGNMDVSKFYHGDYYLEEEVKTIRGKGIASRKKSSI